MKEPKEQVLIMGKRNKKGIFRKIKWLSDAVIISKEEYAEYMDLKYKAGKTIELMWNARLKLAKEFANLFKLVMGK